MEKKQTTKKTKDKDSSNSRKLIVVIRIHGMVKVKEDVHSTLDRLKLRRKYACILVDSKNSSLMGMLQKVKYFVAFGGIDKAVLVKLISTRAKSIEGDRRELKIDAEKVAEELENGKKLQDLKLKPFFRLHPPRKGIDSKLQYPEGVLGNNGKDINKLIERML